MFSPIFNHAGHFLKTQMEMSKQKNVMWGHQQSLGSQEKKDLRKNFNINIENGGLMTVKLIPEPVKMTNSWHKEKLRSLCIYKGDRVRNTHTFNNREVKMFNNRSSGREGGGCSNPLYIR